MHIFLRSFGCATNLADGEVLAGCLATAGHEIVQSIAAADLVVYNTCAVKGPTENRIIHALKRVPKGKKLVVSGCLPLINLDRLKAEIRFDGMLGPAAGEQIVSIIDQIENGRKVVELEKSEIAKPPLNLPRLRLNPVISIVPVSYGCLGTCAYCCVVNARGRLRSYPTHEIVSRCQEDLAKGAKEFWITAEDTGCYGKDIGANLPELLRSLCDIDGDFRIRVGMMTPNSVAGFRQELAKVLQSEKVFKFLHIPLQSGDDAVLGLMRRSYTQNDFVRLVGGFRTAIPNITLSTDVICGFPGESDEAFEHTLRLVEKTKPDIVNVSKFFPRPRTAAAEMKSAFVPSTIVKRRASAISSLARRLSYEKNQDWIGWVGDVLIDEMGKIPGTWIGRNVMYKPVVVKSRRRLLGETMTVKVTRSFATYLEARWL